VEDLLDTLTAHSPLVVVLNLYGFLDYILGRVLGCSSSLSSSLLQVLLGEVEARSEVLE